MVIWQAEMSRRLRYFKTEIKRTQTAPSSYPGLDLMPAPNIPSSKIAEFFLPVEALSSVLKLGLRLLRLRVGGQCPSWPS